MMQEQDSREIISTLGKSGEGLPSFRVFLAKHMFFPLLNAFFSWNQAWDIFDKEGKLMIKLVSTLDNQQLFKRVLVPQLFGLEDNSRYYSVAMVLEHLLIVGSALEVRISLLSRGKKLHKDVKIEDVKPYKEIDEDIVKKYEVFLSTYRERLEKNVDNIHIDNVSKHPWFGDFNPKQWSVLGAMHQFVHRRQIEAILRELEKVK